MINISIEIDQLIPVEEIIDLEKDLQGVYILRNEKGNPIYVGQTGCFKSRLAAHLSGVANTKDYHKEIKSVELIYEDDANLRVLAESYLISKYENDIENRLNFFKNRIDFGEKLYPMNNKMFGNCQGLTALGKPCKKYAHENGFCFAHGGNGITGASVLAKVAEEYINENVRGCKSE